MKTHFCHVIPWYDQDTPDEYIWKSRCGLYDFELWTNNIGNVTCKKCLKSMKKSLNGILKNWNKTHEEWWNCQTITS